MLGSIIRFALSALYTVSGAAKLTARWDHIEQIRKMRSEFVDFSRVFPLVPFGIQPDPETYRFTIGVVEVGLGVLLLLGPRPLRRVSALGLMVVMLGAVQTLAALEKYEMVPVPVVCFLGLLYLFSSDAGKQKQD